MRIDQGPERRALLAGPAGDLFREIVKDIKHRLLHSFEVQLLGAGIFEDIENGLLRQL